MEEFVFVVSFILSWSLRYGWVNKLYHRTKFEVNDVYGIKENGTITCYTVAMCGTDHYTLTHLIVLN